MLGAFSVVLARRGKLSKLWFLLRIEEEETIAVGGLGGSSEEEE